ncbi:MAG: GNAT family N-acetyltransferase [Chloroflexota bacterium]
MLTIPALETQRLRIRRFKLSDAEAYLAIQTAVEWADPNKTKAEQLAHCQTWLEWVVRNYDGLGNLMQPPYGDRAIVDKATDTLIGSVGLVPCFHPFGQLPYFGGTKNALSSTEMGLFWIVSPDYQRQDIATEAAQAMIDYMFTKLRLNRIVATTEYDNLASQAVMKKLGMRLEKNKYPEPAWFQVVGILENIR